VTSEPGAPGAERSLERGIGRLLIALTYVAVVLLAIGVALMFTHGIAPLSRAQRFDPDVLFDDIAALRPDGFLWLGLLAIILAPVARVTAAAVGYARAGDRSMVLVALAILAVLALSVASAIVLA
jgi:uncharacterized membrane protein